MRTSRLKVQPQPACVEPFRLGRRTMGTERFGRFPSCRPDAGRVQSAQLHPRLQRQRCQIARAAVLPTCLSADSFRFGTILSLSPQVQDPDRPPIQFWRNAGSGRPSVLHPDDPLMAGQRATGRAPSPPARSTTVARRPPPSPPLPLPQPSRPLDPMRAWREPSEREEESQKRRRVG